MNEFLCSVFIQVIKHAGHIIEPNYPVERIIERCVIPIATVCPKSIKVESIGKGSLLFAGLSVFCQCTVHPSVNLLTFIKHMCT